MNLKLVKTAPGCRLRHPSNMKVMSCVDDADSQPHKVDLDDPHWYRAFQRQDIIEVDEKGIPVKQDDKAPAKKETPAPAAPVPAAPAPVAAPLASSSPKPSAPTAPASNEEQS